MAVQRNDILWSGVLEDFFAEFLEFFFPAYYNDFDFKRGFVFLDKTLAEMFPSQDLRYPKFVDKLVRVHMKTGQPKWFLVHIEVQGYSQSTFTQRVFTYYYKILEKYSIPVTCLVIYLGKRNKSNESFYESNFLGTKIRFDFNVYYVEEQNEDELLKSKSMFSVIILTALTALKHKRNINKLYNSKIVLAKHLLKSGLSKPKTERLLDFIKLYINFDQEKLNLNFDRQIETLTNKNTKNMGITEQILDITEKKGIEKGELKTKNSIAKKMKSLGIKLAVIAKVTELSIKQIRSL